MNPGQQAVRTPRLDLDPLPQGPARALLAGSRDAVPSADGWPHADSLVVVRAAVELGWPIWLVYLRKSGQVIGECGLKGWADDTGSVEIGYGFAEPFRGQGYGREAVGGILGWLARTGYAREVLAEVAAGNVASRRLVAALGFVEGEARGGYVYYRKPLATRE